MTKITIFFLLVLIKLSESQFFNICNEKMSVAADYNGIYFENWQIKKSAILLLKDNYYEPLIFSFHNAFHCDYEYASTYGDSGIVIKPSNLKLCEEIFIPWKNSKVSIENSSVKSTRNSFVHKIDYGNYIMVSTCFYTKDGSFQIGFLLLIDKNKQFSDFESELFEVK